MFFFFFGHEQIKLDEVQLLYTKDEDKEGREETDIHLITIIETPSTKKSPLPPTPAAKKLREKIYPVRMFLCYLF